MNACFFASSPTRISSSLLQVLTPLSINQNIVTESVCYTIFINTLVPYYVLLSKLKSFSISQTDIVLYFCSCQTFKIDKSSSFLELFFFSVKLIEEDCNFTKKKKKYGKMTIINGNIFVKLFFSSIYLTCIHYTGLVMYICIPISRVKMATFLI